MNTANVAISLVPIEQEWSQVAAVVVNNGDGALTSLNLAGYTCTISYGYTTSAGDEYSAAAPLEVVAQQQITDFRTGQLDTIFSCVGIFDMMNEDEASEEYSPADTNADTVKTILTAIAQATMTCFSHTVARTITFDSEDSLIDTFKPGDYFRVGAGESRLSAFKKALKWTKCKARIEDDGEIHVFYPRITGSTWAATTAYVRGNYVQPVTANDYTYECTTAGTSAGVEPTWPTTAGNTVVDGTVTWTCRDYDYEYDDAVTNHNFFEKSVRNRLVIPNRIYVASHPDHSPQYTGTDNDSASYSALSRYINEYHWLRVTSNAQATSIATAILQMYQIGQEVGHGAAPLNCGQEVMDYIKITDSAANDTRTGNIGYLKRTCGGTKFDMEFRFGSLEIGGIAGLIPQREKGASLADQVNFLTSLYYELSGYMDEVIKKQLILSIKLETLWNLEKVAKWHVTDQLIIPVK